MTERRPSLSDIPAPPRVKRSDQIVEEIKRWIVADRLRPGDRLPQEKELIELFASSKGTVREALKSLEVQGLVSVRTGPRGGAVVESVTADVATRLMRNFLHFRHPTGRQVYSLRKLLEPLLAEAVTGHLAEADLRALEDCVRLCDHPPADWDERRAQRVAEMDFHNVLAARCPDPLLALVCRLLNDLVCDMAIYKKVFLPEQPDFSDSNLRYHRDLVAAFRASDSVRVGALMREHMAEAERFNIELDAQFSPAAATESGKP